MVLYNNDISCNLKRGHGASILMKDPYWDKNGTYYEANSYYRNNDIENDNFRNLKDVMKEVCLKSAYCDGWTWLDHVSDDVDNGNYNYSKQSSNTTHSSSNNSNTTVTSYHTTIVLKPEYYFISELANPIINENNIKYNHSGICYIKQTSELTIFELIDVETYSETRNNANYYDYYYDYGYNTSNTTFLINGTGFDIGNSYKSFLNSSSSLQSKFDQFYDENLDAYIRSLNQMFKSILANQKMEILRNLSYYHIVNVNPLSESYDFDFDVSLPNGFGVRFREDDTWFFRENSDVVTNIDIGAPGVSVYGNLSLPNAEDVNSQFLKHYYNVTSNLTKLLYEYNIDFDLNSLNFSDLLNQVLSNYYVNTSFITDTPDIPQIELIEIDFDYVSSILNDNNDGWIFSWILFVFSIVFDSFLILYRLTNLVVNMSGVIRGNVVRIANKNLRKTMDGANDLLDKLDNMLDWFLTNGNQVIGVNCIFCCFKMTFWCSFICYVCAGLLLILFVYLLLYQIIDEQFIYESGLYSAYISAILTQKSSVNQMLTQTAFGYNLYSIAGIETSRQTQAKLVNYQVFASNQDELDRVDTFNEYFCAGYNEYLSKVKDIRKETVRNSDDSPAIDVNTVIPEEYYDSLYDVLNEYNYDNQYWFESNFATSEYKHYIAEFIDERSSLFANQSSINSSSISIELQLPESLADECEYAWNIATIEIKYGFNWNQLLNYDSSHETIKNNPFVYRLEFGIEYNMTSSALLSSSSDSNSGYYHNTINADSSKFDDYYKQFNTSSNANNAINSSIETQQFDVIWKDINRNIRINFSNLESFYLYSIKFYGNTADKCLCCDSVQFNYFDFDASDNNYIGNDECPSLTPLFGPIYLEIAKLNLIQSLHYLHKPFIVAIRNILLSPFIILWVALYVYIYFKYFMSIPLTYILVHYDLIRTNKVTEMPVFIDMNIPQAIDQVNDNVDSEDESRNGNNVAMENLAISVENDKVETIEMPPQGSLAAQDGLGNKSTQF